MSTTPTTTNETATTLDADINTAVSAAEDIAVSAAEVALDTAVPFFAVPVVKEVTDELIKLAVDALGDKMSLSFQEVGTFIVIDTQISAEQSGISAALAALMIAEKSGVPSAIQAAIQAYANAQSALIHDDGSSPIST